MDILYKKHHGKETIMKIGLMGLPSSGKKTLFKLLTGQAPVIHPEKNAPVPGRAHVRDARFHSLVTMYGPKKEAPAWVDIELLPDLDKRVIQEGKIFSNIALYDALCLVARSFDDESVYHPSGSVNAGRDIDEINGELVLQDMLFVEKRLERIAEAGKKNRVLVKKEERDLFEKFRDHLEGDQPLRTMDLSDEEKKLVSGYPLITGKNFIAVVNCSEGGLSDGPGLAALSEKYRGQGIDLMMISASIESEIEELETEEEKREFMDASGITDPALNRLTSTLMNSLGLVSYFTVGKDEVRQWLVNKGSTAPEAARVIHSDIERGFIRAEVMKFEDLTEHKTEEGVKAAGKFHVMGRDYIVQDGDIISFRFNV